MTKTTLKRGGTALLIAFVAAGTLLLVTTVAQGQEPEGTRSPRPVGESPDLLGPDGDVRVPTRAEGHQQDHLTTNGSTFGYVFNPDNEEINVVNTAIHAATPTSIDTSPYATGPYGTWPWRGALSPDGNWLYASLRDSDQVLVISTTTNSPVMSVTVGNEPHGIAFSADGAYAFVANRGSDTVSVIDTSTGVVTKTIAVDYGPQSITSSPCLNKIYVTNHWDTTVSVIDVGTLAVTKVIDGFSYPWDIVLSPYGHRAYVSNHWPGSIGVIDTINDRLVSVWSTVAWNDYPAGLDISPDGSTLYVAERYGATQAVDTSTGQVIATIPSGDAWEVEVFPASAGPFAYVTSRDDYDVKVVNINTNSITGTIPLGGGPRGLALFPPSASCLLDGVQLFPASDAKGWDRGSTLTHAQTLYNLTGATDSFTLTLSGNVWTTTLSITSTGPISYMGSLDFTVLVDIPPGAALGESDTVTVTATSLLSPTVYSATATLTTTALSGQFGYVFNANANEINVVDTALHVDTGNEIDTSPYGTWPWRGALSPDGNWLYASLRDSDQVLVINTTTNSPVMSVTVGNEPHGIAFSADGAYAFVANRGSDTVSVIDTSTGVVTKTIAVDYGPQSITSSPCLNKIYVTNHWDTTVSVIDVGTLAVTKVIDGFPDPWDIVLSPYGHRAYVSSQWPTSIDVIHTALDRRVDTWSISSSQFSGLDISPDGSTLYAADRYGGVRAVDAFSGQVIATMSTLDDPWEVEVFPASAGPFAYATVPYASAVEVVNINTNSITGTIPLGGGPRGLALFPPSTSCLLDGVQLFPSSAMGVGGAGSTLAYTETLHNLTGATDSFTLTVSGNVWTTTLSITNTGPISYMASVDFAVQVDIPGGATVGSSDLATVTATSVLSPSVYSDTATISTTILCSPTVVYSGQSAQTEGDLDDTYYYFNQKFAYVYVNGYSDDNDTLDATVSGYDPVGATWQTIVQQVNGTGGVIADQYLIPVTYNRVRVQLDDTEDNDLIYYNYQFIVCGLPLRWVPAVLRDYP